MQSRAIAFSAGKPSIRYVHASGATPGPSWAYRTGSDLRIWDDPVRSSSTSASRSPPREVDVVAADELGVALRDVEQDGGP